MTIDKDDWRLNFGKEPSFYSQCKWSLKKWTRTRPHWDHDHCEFCWQKISDINRPNSTPEGWADDQEIYWVCKSCFEDFKEMYKWNLK
jgi:hypothetical protein